MNKMEGSHFESKWFTMAQNEFRQQRDLWNKLMHYESVLMETGPTAQSRYALAHKLAVCGNKMPTRCNRGFYCRSYCLLNIFRAPLCPSSGAQEYYTVVAACGILCCGFSSSWSGVEDAVHPANRTHNPQLHTRPAT